MTETAVQAAATAARDLGLTVTDPTVLYDAFSVVVHLKPSPVVAQAVPGLLEQEDVDQARAEWDVLRPVLTSRAGFEAVFPSATIQAIHGDAPAYNVIPTAGGMLWADFEDATLGPIEWDMAGFGPDLGKVYDEAAVALGRPQLDARVQRVMDTARVLQIVVCTPLVPQIPALADGIRMFVGQWRAMPFAGGLG